MDDSICSGMKWKEVEKLSASRFQRLVGVKRPTFDRMVGVLLADLYARPTRQGRPALLCVEDQLLMMLMYYREYRTFFHIGASFGISETQCWRTVRRAGEQLIASRLFHLPGRKGLAGEDMGLEVVVVDVGESPIERQKKNSGGTTPARKKGTR